jgi:hypothetical protein
MSEINFDQIDSSSNNFESENLLTNKEAPELESHKGKITGILAYIMNLKSLVGIGIFGLIPCVHDVGYMGFGVYYGCLSFLFCMFIATMMHVANKVGYYGKR